MAVEILGPILDLIGEYGLAALFVFLVLDAAMLLPLVPGELLLILAVQRFAPDKPALVLLVVVATAAATVGSLLLYGIARGAGRGFFERHPRLFLMSPRRRDGMERMFQKPLGQTMVLFLRVFPLLRILVNLPAGLARMPVVRFLVLTFIGNALFHAAFLYVAFESRRPDSAVATQATALREAYASPAWSYVQTNWALTAVLLLALGLVLSLRASWKIARNPHEPIEGSLIGSLATATLFWGGAALLAGLWAEPDLVFDLIGRTGYDLAHLSVGLPYEPLSSLAAIGAGAVLLALWVSGIRRSKKRLARAHQRPPRTVTGTPATPPASRRDGR